MGTGQLLCPAIKTPVRRAYSKNLRGTVDEGWRVIWAQWKSVRKRVMKAP